MIRIDKTSNTPIYQQLYLALRQQIIDDKESDLRLPAIRKMAQSLNISINSVNHAYQQLLAEGYLYTIPGSGYYTNKVTITSKKIPFSESRNSKNNRSLSPKIKYDFYYGNITNDQFPWSRWRACLKDALLAEAYADKLYYEHPQGLYNLRKEIVKMIYQTRGVNTTADNLILCSGVQEALRLLTILVPPSSYQIAFEEPGYSTGRNVFIQHNYKIHPIPITARGISIEKLKDSGANLVYLTPSHQFPMGYVLPIVERTQILDYAESVDGYIIEDDYDSEFRYHTDPIPSLQSIDTKDRVIYIGTFSKAFTPSIRVAYISLPDQLLKRFQELCYDWKGSVPSLIQNALFEFLKHDYYIPHMQRCVTQNRKKYNTIIQLFESSAPKQLRPISTEAGVHLMLLCDTDYNETALIQHLKNHDIQLYPTSHYWYTNQEHPVTLQMGFASMDLKHIEEGLELLFKVFPR